MNQHYFDGHSSYPNKRINYPTNLDDEKDWLNGYYAAAKEVQASTFDNDGIDTFLWHYKEG